MAMIHIKCHAQPVNTGFPAVLCGGRKEKNVRILKIKTKTGIKTVYRLDDPYFVGYIDRYKVKEIIRSHMDDQNGDVTEKPSAAELIRAQGAAVKDGIRIGILEKNEGQ